MPVEKGHGVLLTAHGSVEDLDSLPGFLTRIRHGRPAPPELVAEVRRRYVAIGGSPLLAVTERQAALLSARLQMPVFVGMRLSRPELSEALANARARGVGRLCVLPLAPFSVHVYAEAAARALAQHPGAPIELVPVAPFGCVEELVSAQVQAIAPYLPAPGDDSVALVLTAHSLPLSVIESGDRYQIEFEKSAAAVGEALGRPFHVAYQSQGFGGGAWLGPDLKATLEGLAGTRRVVVAPLGFLADHVETLYDLDIEAKAWATELGIEFTRVPALNSAPGLVEALARVAERALFG